MLNPLFVSSTSVNQEPQSNKTALDKGHEEELKLPVEMEKWSRGVSYESSNLGERKEN